MADKLNDLLGRLGKGPRGMGTGLKMLAVAGAAAYGISQSMYTGEEGIGKYVLCISSVCVCISSVYMYFKCVCMYFKCVYMYFKCVYVFQVYYIL